MKLTDAIDGDSFPLTIELNDPSGNSFIKNENFPSSDPKLKIDYYKRTRDQLQAMGFNDQPNENVTPVSEEKGKVEEEHKTSVNEYEHERMVTTDQINLNAEAAVFNVPCDNCGKEGETKMCKTSIPYEEELLIMSFNCFHCGNKNNEVKSSGSVPPQAKKLTLRVKDAMDLKRECYKSSHARLLIPELELELAYGTLGAVYSTIEGLMTQIKEFFEKNNPFVGDSVDSAFQGKVKAFFDKMNLLIMPLLNIDND